MTPTTVARPARRRRPFGVLALIGLQLVTAVGALLAIVGAAASWQSGTSVPVIEGLDASDTLTFVILVAALGTVAVLSLVTLVGLWRLQRWAWRLTIMLVGLSMLSNLWAYFFGEPQFFDMALDVLIVFYLNLRETRAAFETLAQETES